ncbi:MAG: hypothetical protein CMH26_09915 [Micavibrio sp.]|nr:hypothetical protein [Micavibrio sp.]|tara:strand:+ start:686 stop:1606 length:921 start_codon:yes stop_codon:yes gene_type:complete
MDTFFLLLNNLIPLYVIILIGYLASKFFEVDPKTLGSLSIYIILPIVAFGFMADLELKLSYIILPIVVYLLSVIVSMTILNAGRKIYGDSRANLVAMCASMGNMGYFGLPVVFLLFEEQVIGIYMLMILGGNVFESTVAYYIAARGNFDVRTSLIKLARFPSLYAIAAGLIINVLNVELPTVFYTYWSYFKGAYVLIGMMLIGAAMAQMKHFELGPRFIAFSFVGKIIMWPLLALGCIAIDNAYLQLFDEQVHHMLMILALVPQAANIVAFAAQLGLHPEKAATTVLIGTLLALFYIPAAIWLLGM